MVGGFLGLVVPCGDVEAWRADEKRVSWAAPDSSWRVIGFRLFDRERLRKSVEGRPDRVVGWLVFEEIAKNEGVWLAFRVDLVHVKSVTFTRNTKIVVRDREGKRVESEGVCFWPDRSQTSVYDSRTSPVVVSRNAVWCGSDRWGPCGAVKFRAGSVKLGDIVGFEVVGAIADGGGM